MRICLLIITWQSLWCNIDDDDDDDDDSDVAAAAPDDDNAVDDDDDDDFNDDDDDCDDDDDDAAAAAAADDDDAYVSVVSSTLQDADVTSVKLATLGFRAVVSVTVKYPASLRTSVTSRAASVSVRVTSRVSSARSVSRTLSTWRNAIQTAALSASVLESQLDVSSHSFDVTRYLVNHVRSSTHHHVTCWIYAVLRNKICRCVVQFFEVFFQRLSHERIIKIDPRFPKLL